MELEHANVLAASPPDWAPPCYKQKTQAGQAGAVSVAQLQARVATSSSLGLYWGYIRIMEKKMETTMTYAILAVSILFSIIPI